MKKYIGIFIMLIIIGGCGVQHRIPNEINNNDLKLIQYLCPQETTDERIITFPVTELNGEKGNRKYIFCYQKSGECYSFFIRDDRIIDRYIEPSIEVKIH